MDLSAHDQPRTSPPRARLTFRVGVVGHRPNRLQQADLAVLSEVLQHVLVEVKAAANSSRTIVAAVRAAQLMVDEVSDWRVIFQDRPPVLPG